MALVSQLLPLKFGALDSKTDSRFVVPGDLVALRNVVLDNWPKLRKRNGYGLLATAAAGSQCVPFKNQLLVGTGSEAYAYAKSGLVDKGALEAMTVSAKAVRRDAYAQTTPDSAVHPAGISVYTWESTQGGSFYAVYDTATGQSIVSGAPISATAVKPKPFALGQYVVIVFYDTSVNKIRFVSITAANPTTLGAATDFVTDPATTQLFDVAVIGGQSGALYLVYANNAGANTISLKYLTPQLVLGATTTPTTTEAFSVCCSLFGDAAGRVWVAYYTGSAVKAFAYDGALSTLLLSFTSVDASPGTVRNIAGIVATGSTATILYENTGSQTYNNLIKTATLNLAGSVSGLSTLIRSVGLASKPFYSLGRVHFLAAYQSALQSTYFLISGSTPVAKLAPSLGGGLTAKSVLPEVVNPSTGVYATAYLQADQLTSSGGNVFTQAGVMAGAFDFTQPQTAVELSDDLHLTGGILSMFDGQQVCEHGFHLYPENLSASVSGTGLTGSYQYVATWEWMDAQGLLHRSSPSPVLTLNPANQGYQLTIPTLRLTSKATPISVVIWRTQANQQVFYRLTSISSPLLNTTTADTVTFTDNASDASISGNAQLVFNPDNASAELPPLAAPALSHVWRYRNRVAAIPSENAFQWIYSKAFVAGDPIEFNDQNLYQSVSQDGGPLTCGIEMDEKNILFTASRIYYVVGDGPSPNGTGGDYGSAPQNIPSDVGCANRRSLVLTPAGIMFQAANGKGLYLLGRDLSVRYIGAAVEAYNGLTITAAKLVPNSRRVIFFTSGGIALALDYYANKWAVFTNHNAVDATIFGGLVTYLQPNGQILQETPGVFSDNGSPILIGLTTSWLSFSGISGLQRIWRFMVRGDYRSPHVLSVSVAYDDNPAPIQTETVNTGTTLVPGAVGDTRLADTDNPGGGAYPAYEFLIKLARQRCSSMQITIQESQSTPPYGEGLSLSAITFLAGSKKGLHPVPRGRVI